MPIGLSAGAIAGIATAAVSAATAIAGAVGGGSSQSGDISSGQAAANAAQQQALSNYTTNATPYIQTGTQAENALANINGLNGTDAQQNALSSFTTSPGYQFDVQQGLAGIDAGAASRGTLRSGNTVQAEDTLSQNLADQQFTNYYNRLSGLASSGQTATTSLGSAQVSTGAGEASTATSAATAQSGIAANTAKGVGNALTSLAGNSSVQNALSGIGGSTPTSGAGNGSNVGVQSTLNLPQAPANVLG